MVRSSSPTRLFPEAVVQVPDLEVVGGEFSDDFVDREDVQDQSAADLERLFDVREGPELLRARGEVVEGASGDDSEVGVSDGRLRAHPGARVWRTSTRVHVGSPIVQGSLHHVVFD
jgi:hypothetical protein